MKFALFLGALALLATSGCGGGDFVGRPELTMVANTELPPPNPLEGTAGTRPSVLGPGDKIAVNVFGAADLSREVIVESSGAVALPLIGSIQAAGLSPDQLSQEIRSRLTGRYVRNPDVSVNMVEVVSQNFAVDGEVREPGVYPLSGQTTLMRAVAQAGGTGEFADEDLVVLYRKVEGQDMAALYDLRAIRLGAYADPQVYPGDLVVVSEDRAFRLFGSVVQSTGILLTPLVSLLNNR